MPFYDQVSALGVNGRTTLANLAKLKCLSEKTVCNAIMLGQLAALAPLAAQLQGLLAVRSLGKHGRHAWSHYTNFTVMNEAKNLSLAGFWLFLVIFFSMGTFSS